MAERLASWTKVGIAELLENEILPHTGPTYFPKLRSISAKQTFTSSARNKSALQQPAHR